MSTDQQRAASLGRGQRFAESLMTLTVEAYSRPAVPAVDANGFESFAPVLEGRSCAKVQSRSREGDTQTRTFDVGGVPLPVLVGGLHLPIRAFVGDAGLRIRCGDRGIGWEFEVTAVGRADDPSLLGRRYLVVEAPAKSHATARRLDVVEVTGL